MIKPERELIGLSGKPRELRPSDLDNPLENIPKVLPLQREVGGIRRASTQWITPTRREGFSEVAGGGGSSGEMIVRIDDLGEAVRLFMELRRKHPSAPWRCASTEAVATSDRTMITNHHGKEFSGFVTTSPPLFLPEMVWMMLASP